MAERLSEHTRLVVWDKRGTGLSDPVSHVPPIDERMDDLRAVLDAAEIDYPALFGISEGGPMSIVFAATYPERVRSLVLAGTTARFSQELPDFPWGSRRTRSPRATKTSRTTGARALWRICSSDRSPTYPGVREMFGKEQRACASPMMARVMWQAVSEIDVRGVLGSVRTPTLVMARRGDRIAPFEVLRRSPQAYRTPNCWNCRRANTTRAIWSTCSRETVLKFVGQQADAMPAERVLSTVLFTDIVGSTELLAAQGDEPWRRHLDDHDRLVDRVLARYGGRRAKHTGDGIFALFDGPTKAARCGLDLVPALATHGIPIRAACTSANARSAATSGAAWRFTSAHGSARWPERVRC